MRKGRRPRGRPKMRWKDDIMKWQGATWTRTAKDRKKWKELTEGYFQQWRAHSLGTRYKIILKPDVFKFVFFYFTVFFCSSFYLSIFACYLLRTFTLAGGN